MITIENSRFSLLVGEDCIPKSLILKSNGEECLSGSGDLALFSVTQERPYHNEIKLIYPNKRTEYRGNSLRRDGDRLYIGFELLEFEAVVEICETERYIGFKLVEFVLPENPYGEGCLRILPPPVSEFKILQLSLKKRDRFGDWLNVSHDERAAVNVLSVSPYTMADAARTESRDVMYAFTSQSTSLMKCAAALIVTPTDELLDCIDSVERDYGLPLGAASRRAPEMDASVFWTASITPDNADEHIRYAKQGGFSRMLIFYSAFIKEGKGYSYDGDYDFNDRYPNGTDDLKGVLEKIKAAGIAPGIHFLHSHIGVKSRYVTPVADHRLNIKKHFTLAKPLDESGDVVYVEENPEFSPKNPKMRVLKFDGEIIYYDAYSDEYPYCFTGCRRGYFDTAITSHGIGTVGGILDVSEFGATSVYADQRTSLQDEIAEKIAKIYNTGFEFVYMDGSEGVNPPFEFNVPFAQYKIYKRLDKKPLFCEGAAKSHFGWHMLSGGNAFDIFPMQIFKEKIAEYPLSAAPKMADNFTRIDFGWWTFNQDTQPDIYEYGTSKAAACSCPATIQLSLDAFASNPRTDDVLEVMRRWEDVRRKKWLTEEQKELIKAPDKEFILLVDERGEYELAEYRKVSGAACGDSRLSAFVFVRKGKACAVVWHTRGSGKLLLPINAGELIYETALGGGAAEMKKRGGEALLTVNGRAYLSAPVTAEELADALRKARFID